jgi:hypothetical protein
MGAIWFLLFNKSKAMISVRPLGVGIPEQGDVLLPQTIGKKTTGKAWGFGKCSRSDTVTQLPEGLRRP